jgi:hypothetical protein
MTNWQHKLDLAEYWLYRANDYFMHSILDDPALLAWIFCQ